MSCNIEPFIIDFARGTPSDQAREDALQRHLLGCPICAGLFERERVMSAALRRLAESLDEPAPNPHQEEALLAVIDQARARPRPHGQALLWVSATTAAVLLGAVTTLFVRLPSRIPNAISSSVPPAADGSVASGTPMPSPGLVGGGDELPTPLRTLPAPRSLGS